MFNDIVLTINGIDYTFNGIVLTFNALVLTINMRRRHKKNDCPQSSVCDPKRVNTQ